MFSNFKKIFLSSSLFFLLVMPASTNYKLKDFGFGTGGGGNATDGTYSLEAITGEISGEKSTGGSVQLGPGLIFTGQANVPLAPTFDNLSSYYNKLRIIPNASSNPTDTIFAIAISTDNFVTTRYVQNDYTIGDTLGTEDYQTYANWGGGSDEYIIGLTPNTTYKVKVKAMQGKFTETSYGPIATAATANPTLSFDIDVSASDSETSSPFAINMGDLTADTVVDSAEKIWVDLATNGETGGRVYVIGANGGLVSAKAAGYKIDAITGDLASVSNPKGFGAQGFSATGGSFAIAPLYDYDPVGDEVGTVDQYSREIFTASGPLSAGRGSFLLKAKSSTITPAAGDYTETLTVIASGNF
jgi:hypothetical protein